ncbi:ABC transporter permease [Puniceibacterium sp. IMCC21224]|uniref:ABC transporter permease n=1 Tax=Puniceibacterium sp. IMCC21224 TaxID=1618204 RepID=UPI00064DA86F|nr:ABC transporter permease subunit [Puniceibacterium sp. IMCC21224]KMK64665.1 ABC-type nitrate/sulfonate/bicarbonate transport system, permease component [Puniceibacterium sp. IMCC21224]
MTAWKRNLLAFALGCGLLVGAWQIVAWQTLPALLPAPITVASATVALLADPAFWSGALAPSLLRMAGGLSLAIAVGIPLGIIGHRSCRVAAFLAPLRLLLMGIPAPILVILFILWTRGGTWTVILSVAALLMPVFQVAVAEGLRAVDPQIDEMARLFRVPLSKRVRHVIWPAFWTALGPALRIGVANGLRVTLLTELLSGANGLGDAVQTAQTYLQTDRLFALVLIILALVAAFDAALARLPGTRGRA